MGTTKDPDELIAVTMTRDQWKYVRAYLNQSAQNQELRERGWVHGSSRTFDVYCAISDAIGDRFDKSLIEDDFYPTDVSIDGVGFTRCNAVTYHPDAKRNVRCGSLADHSDDHHAYNKSGQVTYSWRR